MGSLLETAITKIMLYTGNKAFLSSFAENLHNSVNQFGVRSMIINAGIIETNFVDRVTDKRALQNYKLERNG